MVTISMEPSNGNIFTASMSRVFPDRTIVDLENKDQIFHTVFDLDERFRFPELSCFYTGRERGNMTGMTQKWRGIYDERGRIMVAICHNMD